MLHTVQPYLVNRAAQMTIYDSLHLVNKTFGFYVNTTVPHGCDSYPKACDVSACSSS